MPPKPGAVYQHLPTGNNYDDSSPSGSDDANELDTISSIGNHFQSADGFEPQANDLNDISDITSSGRCGNLGAANSSQMSVAIGTFHSRQRISSSNSNEICDNLEASHNFSHTYDMQAQSPRSPQSFNDITDILAHLSAQFDASSSSTIHLPQIQESNLPGVQAEVGDAKLFPCDNCTKSFSRRSDLVRHRRIHAGDRRYKCDHPGCTKTFIQRSALTIHSRTHSGERPHPCEHPHCNKAFGDSSSLARHRRTHTGRRPFSCLDDQCDKTFTRRSNLHQHMKLHDPYWRPDTIAQPELDVSSQRYGVTTQGELGRGTAISSTGGISFATLPSSHDFAPLLSDSAQHIEDDIIRNVTVGNHDIRYNQESDGEDDQSYSEDEYAGIEGEDAEDPTIVAGIGYQKS